jgi:hypothetical protein
MENILHVGGRSYTLALHGLDVNHKFFIPQVDVIGSKNYGIEKTGLLKKPDS